MPPGVIFEIKIHQNASATRTLPWTPLRELTALPQSPWLVFTGPLCGRGGEGIKREGREGGKGREGEETADKGKGKVNRQRGHRMIANYAALKSAHVNQLLIRYINRCRFRVIHPHTTFPVIWHGNERTKSKTNASPAQLCRRRKWLAGVIKRGAITSITLSLCTIEYIPLR